jgi:ferric-dicitrate binding protein FerR (iron transport regulator)
MNDKKYSDNDWNELASMLSGESAGKDDLLRQFADGDTRNIPGQWRVLRKVNEQDYIDVEGAWARVSSRLGFSDKEPASGKATERMMRSRYLMLAASILLLLGIASALLLTANKGLLTGKRTISTAGDESNVMVKLPDQSTVWLNRNTRLTWKIKPEGDKRTVTLTGEAFFDIVPDPSRPFIVDAGKAKVKVLGTSFNVITSNEDSAVEVFVKTGRVIMAGNSEKNNLILDPGYIGTMNEAASDKKVNENRNYMSWNTGQLTYDGQKLGIVFQDLRKMYGIEIIADDSSIMELPIATTFNHEQHETIIRIICTTFNLTYRQDGNIYHIGKK